MKAHELPAWYLARAVPRLRMIDELSPIACPNGRDMPTTPEGREAMHEARREWDDLMRRQLDDEIAAGL